MDIVEYKSKFRRFNGFKLFTHFYQRQYKGSTFLETIAEGPKFGMIKTLELLILFRQTNVINNRCKKGVRGKKGCVRLPNYLS